MAWSIIPLVTVRQEGLAGREGAKEEHLVMS